MTKKLATVKSTGGGPFVFEDKVAAYFLTCLISFHPPFNSERGLIERVEFQRRTAGWFLDDMVLHLRDEFGSLSRAAFSVKSNIQFGVATAPSDFVKQAWTQFLTPTQAQFDKSKDRLGLINPPLDANLEYDLAEFRRWAHYQEPEQLQNEIAQASENRIKLFKSFECPDDLISAGTTKPITGELFRVLLFPHQYDFENLDSHREREAIEYCQNILVSESLTDGRNLWEKLLRIAADYRSVGGFLDPQIVFPKLYQFHLKGRPEHRDPWVKLLEYSRDAMKRVTDTIGGIVKLTRDSEVAKLHSALQNQRQVAILGGSGTGKSVVLRRWAESELSQEHKLVWLEAQVLEKQTMAQYETSLGLGVDIRALFAEVTDEKATLVVDGIDRIYAPDAFKQLGTLFEMLRLKEETSPWRVLLTCQTPEWARIEIQLRQAGLAAFHLTECQPLTDADLDTVWRELPTISHLSIQPKLHGVFKNLQLLDRVALRLGSNAVNTTTWVSESNIIEWLWNDWFQQNPAGSKFVKQIGEFQADKLRSVFNESDFEVTQLQLLPDLIKERICRNESGNIRFEHDLFGDWARQRFLIDQREEVYGYLEPKLSSPLWHRALRLYGQFLLECNSDESAWREALEGFSGGEDFVARDLLLEAPAFATDSFALLERVAPTLFDNEGLLLKRLLKRFLHTATVPNLEIMQIAASNGISEDKAALLSRQPKPFVMSWFALLRFLYNHRLDVLKIAPTELAKITEFWLETVSDLMRREVSELGLALGEQAWNKRNDYRHDDLRPLMYKIALLAGDDLPDETSRFALIASERLENDVEPEVVTSPWDFDPNDQPIPRITLSYREMYYPDKPDPEPWAEGPKSYVDETFRDMVLDSRALLPLMRTRPKIAREVMLALLINAPENIIPDHSIDEGSCQIRSHHGWSPAFYTNGSFLDFLKINFDEGLGLILQLVQFAVERWQEQTIETAKKKPQDWSSLGAGAAIWEERERSWLALPKSITLHLKSGERTLIGDSRVFGWYRGLRGIVPQEITSALMALEQFLYEKLERNEDISELIGLILEKTQNAAMLGLLCNMACRQPKLLETVLNPLIYKLEIFHWDMTVTTSEHFGHAMIGAGQRSEWFFNLARDFHNLAHRKTNLENVVRGRMFSSEVIRQSLESARREWTLLLDRISETELIPEYVKRMILGLDPQNWRMGDRVAEGFQTWNPKLADLDEENMRDPKTQMFNESTFVMQFAFKCCEILESQIPLEETALESFWASVLYAKDLKTQENRDVNWGVHHPNDCIAGGVAVVVCLHFDWLKSNSDRADWCIENLSEIISTLSDYPAPERLASGIEWDWLSFAAQAIPILWADFPEDKTLREWVLILLSYGHKTAINFLASGCAQQSKPLGNHFQQFHRFALEFACIRQWLYVKNVFEQRIGLNGDDLDLIQTKLEGAFQEWGEFWMEGFVDGQTPSVQVPWQELSTHALFQEVSQITAKYTWLKNRTLLEIQFVRATHSWLENLELAQDIHERQQWIEFWKEALLFILPQGKPSQNHRRETINYPNDEERWVLSHIAKVILQMSESENPSSFWKPILSLPARKSDHDHSWITYFLGAWHRIALQSNPVPNQYINTTKEMFQFTKAQSAEETKWSSYSEPWLALLGIGVFDLNNWQPQHKNIVKTLQEIFIEFELRTQWVRPFAKFLQLEAAESIRLTNFNKLGKYLRQNPNTLQDIGTQEPIASLLHCVWKEHESLLRQQTSSFKLFKDILRMLVDQNLPSALELNSRMASN
jgi:hypothetical protein